MSSIRIEIIKRKAIDLIRFVFMKIIGPAMGFASFALLQLNLPKIALKYALKSHRGSYSKTSLKTVRKIFCDDKINKNILTDMVGGAPSIEEVASRYLVVRWPLVEEDKIISKGIIIVTFTRTFSYFLKKINLTNLETFFNIVLEPSWAGYFDADILSWQFKAKNPVFLESSEILDRISIGHISNNLVPISVGASDWVDYNTFHPTDDLKTYDSVYVANTSRGKRVHKFFESLAKIKDRGVPDYKGILVCAEWGGRVKEIEYLKNYYKLDGSCEIRFGLNQNQLREVLNKSKVNILLSKKEGSNRSLFEAMFCNTPVIGLIDNIGVNKSYFNEFTGMLTWDEYLPTALLLMRDRWSQYQPRDWAMDNISPDITSEKVCRVVANCTGDRQLFADISKGDPCFVKVNRPEVQYLSAPEFDKKTFNTKLLQCFVHDLDFNDLTEKILQLKNEFYSLYYA